jgi:hypothetical protein
MSSGGLPFYSIHGSRQAMKGHGVMGWFYMLRDLVSMFPLIFIALAVALLGDPLRDEGSDAGHRTKGKQN